MEPVAIPVQCVDDDVWRRDLCPDCGLRLIGLRAWRDHGGRHGWSTDWLAARLRAARPGEIVSFSPALLAEPEGVEVRTVADATWKAGLST